jgi:hypothetical protein
MKDLLSKITKLIDVKSIITLTLTFGFIMLVVKNTISGQEYMSIYTTIIGFYFGTQYEKNKL